MNLKYWILSGQIPPVHPAAMFLLLTFLAMAFLFRKAFCSWLCPIGTISEYLWRAGKKFFGRNLFFRHIGETGLIVLGMFVLASVLVQNFWCRFLCPYGALLGLTSWLSPTRIRRNTESCIDCAKCAKACPSALPVDRLVQIRSVECTGCLECVAVRPAQDALAMSLPKMFTATPERPVMPAWAMAAGIALLFVGVAGFAKATGHWQSPIPSSVYQRLVPNADQAAHPIPGR